ncbi:hypothetical protein [Rickettsia endosymbiont of Ixodes scapularis]|uniref:hypothetical protein n=1 Tax=Rickettsia endosymbiont of Ixodes scapularis TaxID=444612 RepID=UPI00030A69ED|nr:hypothetical protein [Rickettsia endosymbiont of Ixodes scapularis]
MLNKTTINLRNYSLVIIFLVLCNLKFDTAYAIGYMLHDDSILKLQIAKDAPTRISIEGEKINDVFIHPKDAAEVVVHNSGCLFILPQVGNNKVYLTIISESGIVQDLSLRFIGKNPSPIRLLKFDLVQDLAQTTNIKQEKKNENKQISRNK